MSSSTRNIVRCLSCCQLSIMDLTLTASRYCICDLKKDFSEVRYSHVPGCSESWCGGTVFYTRMQGTRTAALRLVHEVPSTLYETVVNCDSYRSIRSNSTVGCSISSMQRSVYSVMCTSYEVAPPYLRATRDVACATVRNHRNGIAPSNFEKENRRYKKTRK